MKQVNSASQPSFLQHAVHLDLPNKRLCVLGEINKGFVISPNIDTLLASVDKVGSRTSEELLKMDTT